MAAGDLRVAVIEERLELIAGERATAGVGLELRDVNDQVALINDLLRERAEPAGADRDPRIATVQQTVWM